MNSFRKACRFAASLVTSVVLSIGVVVPAHAANSYVVYTDIYYLAGEEGWGMQLVGARDFFFATLFIYGQDGKPTWVTGELQGKYIAPDYVYTGPV